MPVQYDTSAAKKATNLSVNSDLLRRSLALKINLSATLKQALKEELANREAEQWAEENRNAIVRYNMVLEEHCCFGDDFRTF